MIAGIIRSWLRPAHAQPVDDENSSLHVHVDAEGRAKDQIYWEKEKERERRRTARSNTRAQPAAGGSSIELAPRLPIFHGTGSPSTEGPVPSVNELVAPVLDRRAERFPAHGGVGVPTAHLHSIPVAPSPPVIVPPSQPRSGNIGTTSATFNMAESHDHYVPIPGFSEPSAEECMALAAAEAARKREEEDALSAPAPPLPSQSPVLSEMDYRTMNLSPGPAPSFLEPYYPQQNPPVSTENPEQPAALQIPSQQPLPTTPQSKITHPKRVSPFIATATSVKGGVPPIASSTGVVSSVAGDAKVKKPKSSKKTPEVESITPAGESKHRDKGKDREHHVSGKTSSSKRARDKERDGERDKDRHKHKSSEDKKESKEKKEKKIRKHREKQKESTIQIPPGMAPAHAAGRVSSSMPHKEKENVPPPAKTAVPPPEGILKSTEERKHHSRRSEDHDNGAQREHRHHHHSRHKSSVTDPETGKKKTVKVRTPEEQAAHDQRKEERARVKAAEKAARQAAKINEGAEGANSDKVVSKDDKPHEKHHKGKSSTRGDGERKHRHRRREGETEEERSQRKAAKRARKLAEAVKADAVNATLGTPPSEGNKRHSTNLDLTGRPGRILSPVPEGSTEPADSIRLPLSPAGYPIPKATPIPDLPELPAGDVIRNSSGPFGEPTAYTQAQIPPRPSTPPPAAYSQGIALPPAGAVHIAQLRHRRSYDEKIVVLPEAVQSNHAGSSRHRTSKSKAPLVIPLVPQPVATSSAVPESKEERRRRKSERAQPASQTYPPPAAAIVPPEEAHAARQHRKKRTPEEIEAKRLRKEARKAKVAAANAALQAINEDEALTSASGAYQTKDSGPELTAYQANALRNNSVLGLHQPDPRTQPGYGHYGYGTDGKTIGLTSPPPGKGPKHKKSVTIDTGARDGGPSYARDGREKLREKERERQRKEREKEAKANEAKTKAQNTTGKRFGMFSLKRSFSKLFRV